MMGIIEAVVRQSDCLILPMSAASQAVIPGRRIATGSATTAGRANAPTDGGVESGASARWGAPGAGRPSLSMIPQVCVLALTTATTTPR
jgi:hypothetical protein